MEDILKEQKKLQEESKEAIMKAVSAEIEAKTNQLEIEVKMLKLKSNRPPEVSTATGKPIQEQPQSMEIYINKNSG